MRIHYTRRFIGLAGLLAAGIAQAGTVSDFFDEFLKARAEGRTSTIVGIDNDTLLLNRDDGFYTSGMSLGQASTLRGTDGAATYGWRIAQELYTASDIKLPPAQFGPPDHPYAGWLYGGIFKEIHRNDGTSLRYGLDLGCLGPCAGGRWTQTNFHRVIDQPLPQGWSKQVRNEAGIVLHGEITPVRWRVGNAFDLAPTIQGRLGNIFTDLGIGLTARAGNLNLLPQQPALYGFLRTDVRAVGYNATLQGGLFSKDNPHTVDPKRVVGEVEAGVVWTGQNFGARLGLVRRSNEIRDLPDSQGAQNFLRLQISYTP
ncbi:lipid A deacylase LpxR family protein [Noviherbaspirillum malthae]|uniref:lipid A deacylase LpxR family protein n=1 Tax=Noviherbaspirillum malthae TaxID=1260987 RepID=UPI00188F71D6|nr:lipid A deacylase LpxR family protein [Noviherbaspirillum malthae]